MKNFVCVGLSFLGYFKLFFFDWHRTWIANCLDTKHIKIEDSQTDNLALNPLPLDLDHTTLTARPIPRAAVVAQAVEQQVSIQAGRVRIPGPSMTFSADCLYSHWALGFFF